MIRINYEKRLRDRFERNFIPEPNCGCWLWLGSLFTSHNDHRSGRYGAFYAWGRQQGAHRVSFQLYKGQIKNNLYVLHTCDVRCCVNPEHLFLGTALTNMQDMIAKGRGRFIPRRGEQNSQHRLNWSIVRSIRKDVRSAAKIAAEVGVSREVVRQIKLGVDWPEQ